MSSNISIKNENLLLNVNMIMKRNLEELLYKLCIREYKTQKLIKIPNYIRERQKNI